MATAKRVKSQAKTPSLKRAPSSGDLKRFNMMAPKKDIVAYRTAAKKEGMSMSEWVRRALTKALGRRGK